MRKVKYGELLLAIKVYRILKMKSKVFVYHR